MHCTNTKTVGSIVSELKTSLRNVLVWYGTLVRLVRSLKQSTSVPYPYLQNKRVPYFLKILIRTAILGLKGGPGVVEDSLRTHFEVLGLEAQVLVLGLGTYKSSKRSSSLLKDIILFWLVEKENKQTKTNLNF